MNYSKWASAYDDIFPFSAQKFTVLKNHIRGNKLLDVGCATGEYALKFAALGYDVKGIDLSNEMIEKAREKVDDELVRFEVFDMTKPIENNTYDSIYIIGNTLVHLNDEIEIENTLKNFYQALKKGGNLIVQILNYHRIIDQHITTLPLLKGKQYKMERHYQLKNAHIEFHTTLYSQSLTYHNSVMLFPLKFNSLENIVKRIGFRDVNFYNGFSHDVFNIKESNALVGVFSKPKS